MHAALEVFKPFLKLGVSSFGGPMAHVGYFRQEFVVRRRWLEDEAYADLVALVQFLPGPGSSQLAFTMGLMRAGFAGALAAWAGFTLPSALLLVAFARAVPSVPNHIRDGLMHGLKLVAVAIVAQALLGMARTLCPDWRRASIAAVAALIVVTGAGSFAQVAAIGWGALAGLGLHRLGAAPRRAAFEVPVSRRAALIALAAFTVLLLASLLRRDQGGVSAVALFQAFYRAGALVFGGGHVVLPLLRDAFVTPGWVSDGDFLAGYGAAQAVPGPLFSFAAYLGAVVNGSPHGATGAVLGLFAIFLPGMLVLIAVLPHWQALRTRSAAQSCIAGINAAVVGILAAALYDPVWVSSVRTPLDAAAAGAGFALLAWARVPPLLVVLAGASAGVALAVAGR